MFTGFYAFLDASTVTPGAVAALVSPEFPEANRNDVKCLTFKYIDAGTHRSHLNVYNQFEELYWSNTARKSGPPPLL